MYKINYGAKRIKKKKDTELKSMSSSEHLFRKNGLGSKKQKTTRRTQGRYKEKSGTKSPLCQVSLKEVDHQ